MRLLTPPSDPPARTAPFDPSRQQPVGGRNRVALDAPQREAPEAPATRVWRRLARFVGWQTGLTLSDRGSDISVIQQWMWAQPYDPHPDYKFFRGIWYGRIDPRFQVNGIPPFVDPQHVGASSDAAAYLDDNDIVFGFAINGETRALPQRILAWHEMALDTLGGGRAHDRVLHALWHGHPIRERGRWRAHHVRDQRLVVSLQQTDVRPRDQQSLGIRLKGFQSWARAWARVCS